MNIYDIAIKIGSVLLGIIILVILVVVHELGHAIMARRSGVVVEEFGIGFPPKAWGRNLRSTGYRWAGLSSFRVSTMPPTSRVTMALLALCKRRESY
jgi:membrane-associated protease RseP (regulator of RpoE activity)